MASTINSDNGVVSGSSGLKSTADTSGVLALQSNGTTGLTLNTSLALGVGSGNSTGSSGQVLTSAGSGAAPAWATPTVTSPAGSTGQVQYNNAGAFGAISSGTSGQVLTSGGSGAAPTWSTPNSGAMVFISSQTVSTAVANVDFTSGFSTTYDNYVILLDGITCSNTGTLGVRFYKDGVLASASGYLQAGIKSSSTTVSAFVGAGDSYFQVFGGDTVNGSSSYISGAFTLYSANANTASMTFSANVSSTVDNASNKSATGGGRNSTTGSFTGIRFFWTAGYNFTAGTFKLYGIKKA